MYFTGIFSFSSWEQITFFNEPSSTLTAFSVIRLIAWLESARRQLLSTMGCIRRRQGQFCLCCCHHHVTLEPLKQSDELRRVHGPACPWPPRSASQQPAPHPQALLATVRHRGWVRAGFTDRAARGWYWWTGKEVVWGRRCVHEETTTFWPLLLNAVHSYGPEPEAKRHLCHR